MPRDRRKCPLEVIVRCKELLRRPFRLDLPVPELAFCFRKFDGGKSAFWQKL
jgi:hypothetical protein